MNLARPDFFSLLSLPRTFRIDRASLDANYRTLQTIVHPDKFASRPAAEQRIAAARSADLNTAYQVLKNSAQRAQYLCDLQVNTQEKNADRSLSPAFLMEQMDLREALADVKSACDQPTLANLSSQVSTAKRQTEQALNKLLDDDGNYAAAQMKINELMFLEKLLTEIGDVQAALDH